MNDRFAVIVWGRDFYTPALEYFSKKFPIVETFEEIELTDLPSTVDAVYDADRMNVLWAKSRRSELYHNEPIVSVIILEIPDAEYRTTEYGVRYCRQLRKAKTLFREEYGRNSIHACETPESSIQSLNEIQARIKDN